MTDTEMIEFLGKKEGYIPHQTRGQLNDLLYGGQDIREILTRRAAMHAAHMRDVAGADARRLYETTAPFAL